VPVQIFKRREKRLLAMPAATLTNMPRKSTRCRAKFDRRGREKGRSLLRDNHLTIGMLI